MLVKIEQLQVHYGKQLALDINQPIEISEGERIGIIGANGAGKSTFVKTMLGLTDYTGKIQTKLKPEDMAVHLQFNYYVNTMPVRNIMEMILNTSIKKNAKLQELIAYFDFEPCLKKRYTALSGGQKQRLTIIMVMMQDAPLTFYDEVTSGLDFETRQRLMEKLMQWYEGKKNTLCIVSHYYEELELLADKLLILDHGKVIDFGDKQKLFRKYCGKSVITMDRNEKNESLITGFSKIDTPAHLLGISCRSEEEEEQIATILIQNDVNFKRSNHDIELLYTNAKNQVQKKGGRDNE